MWEQWKNKFKSLFGEEEEHSEEEVSKNHPASNVKARMTYQYPKKSSFRFPVIPDERVEKKQRDIPVYQQKETSSYKRKETPAYQRKKEEKIVRKQQEPEKISNKVYKKTDTPFKVSEVPSPIYGLQKRKKDEIDDVPAFMRKDEIAAQTDQIASTVEKQLEKPTETKLVIVPEIRESSSVTADSLMEQQEQKVFEESKQENHQITQESKQKDGQVPDEIKQEDIIRKKDDKPAPSNVSQIERSDNQRVENKTPFNVMMTPRDKKNLFDRRKRLANEENDRNHASMQEKEVSKPNQVGKREENRIPTTSNTASKQQDASSNIPMSTVQVVEQVEKKETYLPDHLLNDPVPKSDENYVWVENQKALLEQTLTHFNVQARVVKATQGPSVTRFEVHPELGVKVSKIKSLSDDLKLNMSARDIRIEAPIPGKNTVGIEIPNLKAQMVGLQEIFEKEDFKKATSPLTIALGLSIEGEPAITNIQKMPHGLIAGATGSGKSVCINTILISLIYKANYDDVKFLLIDPKMVELAPYNGIPHLVAPVITDVKAATQSLKWAVTEMEDRYERFVHEGVRDIERYNKKVTQQGRRDKKMPFIIIVIDELADLMMSSPQDVEDSISRIAQKARACGIHLILATQRPSVDVITGLIKANIPTRIAFSVSSQIDSRTIIDVSGAEKLLGKGDMLFAENGAGKTVRLQGPFVSDEEIERVTNYARTLAEPNYLFEQEQLLEQVAVDEEEDELLQEAIQFVLRQNSASTSLLQRHFKIGYNRAARLIDTLESRGIISGQNGSKPREVLVTPSQLEEM
ncbi:DNA translocase FtsK [Oceanobacillus chungangensis]|uniref:DNA translocase FtsK n=1 Tax=Oceanobacillus chungangensis TaxID=1229152 RepID=A0A3D8Q1S3_9BACI|nr:DNA translocase FtsK [Oceanobacillus chungangensis]RDW21521.1 DNA translocase FtsK [Oceanobacillus chungangensis]